MFYGSTKQEKHSKIECTKWRAYKIRTVGADVWDGSLVMETVAERWQLLPQLPRHFWTVCNPRDLWGRAYWPTSVRVNKLPVTTALGMVEAHPTDSTEPLLISAIGTNSRTGAGERGEGEGGICLFAGVPHLLPACLPPNSEISIEVTLVCQEQEIGKQMLMVIVCLATDMALS